MQLSRTTDYAIQAVVALALNGGYTMSCTKIAEQRSLPARFLLQILRSLAVAGIVESTRGVQGGYRLAKASDKVTVRHIWEAIEGPIALRTSCAELQPTLDCLARSISVQLDEFTVADLTAAERMAAQVPA